ncbi:MAG: YtxH domain-containing protein [Cyanobacteria bacterium P01_H01_bin.74]
MSSSASDSDLFSLLAGLVIGLLGGSVVGLLYSPKSGDALRQDFNSLVQSLPERLNDPNCKTKAFIEKARVSIEDTVDRFKEDKAASKMAKAKAQEMASAGYELN